MIDTKALRQKVLDLAIRGKLVPQDPNDEPASVLLERIRAQKQQMVKDGKLKAKDIKNDTVIFVGEDNLHYEKFADGTVKCIEDEIPFDLPDGWAWARVFSVSTDLPYGTAKKSYATGSIAVLRMGNLQNGEIDYHDLVYSSDKDDIQAYSLYSGDLLFNRTNSAELVGKTAIYRGNIPAIYAGYLIRIRPLINSEYLNIVMNSQYAKEYCYYVKADSVSQSNINANKLGNFIIPVPPIREQDNISKQITYIYPVLSILQEQKESLIKLCSETKSKILDLAIRGQLVPQDPADEPASVLLDRIRTEKEGLIKQDKIKRDKKESAIFKGEDNSYYEKIGDAVTCIDEEIPFDIPENWCWCRLGNIFVHNTGKALNSSNTAGKAFTYITTSNVYWNRFELDHLKTMPFTDDEIEKCTVQKGDLLVCEGGDIGRSAIWPFDEEIRIQNHIHRVRAYGSIVVKLYYYIFFYYKQIGKINGNGIGLQGLSSNQLHSILLPLAPFAEQQRITETIDELFGVLENIEAGLN